MRLTLISLTSPMAGHDPYESEASHWALEQDDTDFEWISSDEQGLKDAILRAKGDYIAILHPHEQLAQSQTIAKIKASLKMTRFDLAYGDVAVREDADEDSHSHVRFVKDSPLQIPLSYAHIFMRRTRLLSQLESHDGALDVRDIITEFISRARTAVYLKFPVTMVTLRLARYKRAKDHLTCKPAQGSRRMITSLTRGMVMVLPFVTQPVNDQPQTA
jgi:hypothetical protein